MEYLKIWVSLEEVIEPLNDAERGRLLTAMLGYADREEAPELRGNERFVWPVIRQAIDRERAMVERLTANGSKGGRPRKETKENQEKPTETNGNQEKPTESHKEKDKEKDKDNTGETPKPPFKGFEDFWAAYPKKQDKKAAEKAFARLRPGPELLERMIRAVKAWANSEQWTKDGGQYIPLPSTWLNGRRWEDEGPGARHAGKQVSAQMYTQREYTEEELEGRAGGWADQLMLEAARKYKE